MAQLTYLFIHCAYTGPNIKLTPDHIRRWHTDPKPQGNGWSRVGYSDMIDRDGILHNLASFDQDNEVDYNEMTWGVKGANGVSRHLVLEGGKDADGNDESPLVAYPKIAEALGIYVQYTILRHPQIQVAGHYQFDGRKPFCPGFDVPNYCRAILIPESNICLP